MRRIRSAVIGLALVSAAFTPLLGLQANPAAAKAGKVKVGLAIIGGVNDFGFNSLANIGLKEAESNYNVQGRVIVTPQNGITSIPCRSSSTRITTWSSPSAPCGAVRWTRSPGPTSTRSSPSWTASPSIAKASRNFSKT